MFLSRSFHRKAFRWIAIPTLIIMLLAVNVGLVFAANDHPGAVYVQTNQASGNTIAIFNRSTDGGLALSATVPTGGLGTGAGLGSEGSVILSNDGRWLFATNAGSNEISAFRVQVNGLTLVDKVASGGTLPISLALYKNRLYVLNAGASGNISGFTVDQSGKLTSLAGSPRLLSNNGIGAAPRPAQVSFSPTGKMF